MLRNVLLALCFSHVQGIVVPTRQGRGDKFDIVVNTFQRDECLRKVVKYYRTCGDVVDAIHVVWNEPDRQPPEWLSAFAGPLAAASDDGPRVVIDYNEGTNLTNRFKPRTSFSSTALFSQDDDEYFSCTVLRAGFRVWQQNPQQVVGFGPRWVRVDGPVKQTTDSPFFQSWKERRTNVVLPTKGAWLDKKYYELFFEPSHAQLRDMIDSNRTAEDFMMALLVASATKQPPVPLVLRGKDINTELSCSAGLTDHSGPHSSRSNRPPLFKTLLNEFNNGLYPTTDFINPLKEPASWKVDPTNYLPV